jgi:hypothetical protein
LKVVTAPYIKKGWEAYDLLERLMMNIAPLEMLQKYGNSFRELINRKNFSSDASIQELLRLNKKEDWGFIWIAMDIVGDTSMAIGNFLQFGLDGPTRYDELGEKYLRLYGVLNATYVQQEAIYHLYKLMNVPNCTEALEKIKRLIIRDVRHKLAAHSTAYKNSITNEVEAFVPIQFTLAGYHCTCINNKDDDPETFDLKECLTDHLQLMIELLDKTYEKTINSLYKTASKTRDEFLQDLEDLRYIRNGGIIIDMPGDSSRIKIDLK